jgi:hypothetical protein
MVLDGLHRDGLDVQERRTFDEDDTGTEIILRATYMYTLRSSSLGSYRRIA